MDARSTPDRKVCLLCQGVQGVSHCSLTARVSEYISLLNNMVHYNAAYLDDVIVSGLVM